MLHYDQTIQVWKTPSFSCMVAPSCYNHYNEVGLDCDGILFGIFGWYETWSTLQCTEVSFKPTKTFVSRMRVGLSTPNSSHHLSALLGNYTY